MTPFFFRAAAARLFGVYFPPQGKDVRRGVVLCYPSGEEYYVAYRACRFLAQHLAAAGLHVLRFDYPGTGDSSGEADEFGIDAWCEGLDEAASELKAMSGVSSLTFIGLRLGAFVASAGARRRSDVASLVLWDPGRPLDGAPGAEPADAGRLLEDFGRDAAGLPDTLILNSTPSCSAYNAEVLCLEGAGVTCSVECVPSDAVWSNDGDFGSTALPVEAVRAVTRWVAP